MLSVKEMASGGQDTEGGSTPPGVNPTRSVTQGLAMGPSCVADALKADPSKPVFYLDDQEKRYSSDHLLQLMTPYERTVRTAATEPSIKLPVKPAHLDFGRVMPMRKAHTDEQTERRLLVRDADGLKDFLVTPSFVASSPTTQQAEEMTQFSVDARNTSPVKGTDDYVRGGRRCRAVLCDVR